MVFTLRKACFAANVNLERQSYLGKLPLTERIRPDPSSTLGRNSFTGSLHPTTRQVMQARQAGKDEAMSLARPKTIQTCGKAETRPRQNQSAGQAILNTLEGLDDPAGVREFAGCLCSEDTPLHNLAMEPMRRLGDEGAKALRSLLADPDPEVRLFALDILDAARHPDAEPWLIEVIERDPHPNVSATAVELLCELGTEAAIDPLLHLKARFPRNLFIQFAADLALKRILEA
jgi:hypothetical protein